MALNGALLADGLVTGLPTTGAPLGTAAHRRPARAAGAPSPPTLAAARRPAAAWDGPDDHDHHAIALASSPAFAGGFVLWTLAEYLLHRFAMHDLKGKGIMSREHLEHHVPLDLDVLVPPTC